MNSKRDRFWLSGKGIAALGLIAGASYFLLMEHRQHLFAALPYLILLLCPLMHLFMHHGHHHGHHGKDEISDRQRTEEDMEGKTTGRGTDD